MMQGKSSLAVSGMSALAAVVERDEPFITTGDGRRHQVNRIERHNPTGCKPKPTHAEKMAAKRQRRALDSARHQPAFIIRVDNAADRWKSLGLEYRPHQGARECARRRSHLEC